MTSVSAHLPHENEGGTDKFPLHVANGFHNGSHFESDCNGFLGGEIEPTKLPTCENPSVIKAKQGDVIGKKKSSQEKHHPIDLSTDDNLLIPFPLLAGENVEQRILCSEANVILTNYRLFACLPESFHNIPVRTIEYVEMRELTVVHVNCKFGKVVRICLDTPEDCAELWRHITSLEASQLKTDDLFAFKYFSDFNSSKCNGIVSKVINDRPDCEAAMYVKDMKRMGFNTQTIWRTTEINSKFEVCKTYPKFHIVPAWISDDELIEVAQFRSMRRFPSVVWRSKSNGCVIARCSQPEVGWFGWRCEKDEHLLSAIAQAASLDSDIGTSLMSLSVSDIKPQSFLLVDARSYATAVANRAKGGGCECQEYYPTCDIQFMGLVNIHAIRKSFQSVRSLSVYGQEQPNWYSSLEKTGWLHYLSALIRSSLIIVEAIDVEKRSAVVHCTDGWDRTTQLVSLAELLLDPYYRTIKGFSVLVEREWLEFGHKFADRCGHSPDKNINEISPVFFQWVDAVHQIMKQFPSAFQFNESFLIKLVQHVYSCLFGTFLCNSIRERHQIKLKNRTASIWDLLLSGKKDFINFLYVANDKKVLYPSYHIRNIEFWENVFIGDSQYPDVSHRSDGSKAADLSDSGNFTQNSNSSTGCSKYFSNNVSNENHVSPTEMNINENATATAETLLGDDENENIFSKSSDEDFKSAENCIESNGVGDIGMNIVNESTVKLDSTISNSHLNCTNNCSPVDLNNISDHLPCVDGESLEDEANSTISDSANENANSMTDSVKTLTGEVDRPQSYDDSCIPVKTYQDAEVDPAHLLMDNRPNSMRKVHSTPDSPKLTRLPRTKSVPDVMTASLCIENDMNKQFPSLENSTKQINKELFRDLSRYVDCDGLTIIHNYVDHKLLNIELNHSQEISKLQKRIQIERQTRISLQQQLHQLCSKDGEVFNPVTICDASQDDLLSLPDSVNGERSSISSLSNDEGWEQVQYDDVQPTRWVPDHVSSCCSHCGQQFSIIFRRHHCRKCGAVFCDACSNYQISVPDEQLYKPVRVCSTCYDNIMHSKT